MVAYVLHASPTKRMKKSSDIVADEPCDADMAKTDWSGDTCVPNPHVEVCCNPEYFAIDDGCS
eukprot:2328460-Karenia_brevis.AAC.1